MSLVAAGVDPQPTLAWQFEGSTTDLVQGLTGTTTGSVIYEAAKYNQGIRISNLDGLSSNYVSWTSSTAFNIDSGSSLFLWVKFNNLSNLAAIQTFTGIGCTSNTALFFKLQLSVTGSLQAQLQDVSAAIRSVGITTPVANIWYHIGVTFSQGTMRTYLNGAATGTTTYNQTSIILNSPIRIGIAPNFIGFPTKDVTIDDLRLYNTALSALQARSVWSQGAAPASNFFAPQQLKYAWQFENSNVDSVTGLAPSSSSGPVTYSSGKYQQAVNFNTNVPGANPTQLLTYPVSIGGANGFAISYWINLTSLSTSARSYAISLSGGSSPYTGTFYLWVNTGTTSATINQYWQFGNVDVFQTASATGITIPTGQWTHVVWTYRPGFGHQQYFNGSFNQSSGLLIGGSQASIASDGATPSTITVTLDTTSISLLKVGWAVSFTYTGTISGLTNGQNVVINSIPSSTTFTFIATGLVSAITTTANYFTVINQTDLVPLFTTLRMGGTAAVPNSFNGLIDDFRVYNGPLTTVQADAIYRSQGMPPLATFSNATGTIKTFFRNS